jgi:hypothetical protein
MRLISITAVAALLCALAVSVACGGGGVTGGVTVEPHTPQPLTGGKPAAPPSATPTDSPVPTPTDDAPDAVATEPPAEATATPRPTATPLPPGPPFSGRWIEVDVTQYVVRLMDGEAVVREIAPVAVGVQVDTGEYLSTQTGVFSIYNKIEPLVYDEPYNTYISHWVGFDPAKDNGFHSFLKDESGAVVDASTGRVSNGCIRTGDAEAIYGFAEVGMVVWVHA